MPHHRKRPTHHRGGMPSASNVRRHERVNHLTLVDAVFGICEMPANRLLCARPPFTWASESVIATFTAGYHVPIDIQAAGFVYVLGQEDVREIVLTSSSKQASRKTVAELVCHYALLDSYPAWFDDLPSK